MAAWLEGNTEHGPRGPATEAARSAVSIPLCTDGGKASMLRRGKTPVDDAAYGVKMSELLEIAGNRGGRGKSWVPFRGFRASGSNGEGIDGRRPNVLGAASEDIEIYDGTKTNDVKLKNKAWYRHGLYKDVKLRRGQDGALELQRSSNEKFSSCSRRRKNKGMLREGIRKASTRALVSILTGHVKRFLDDESFRESIRRGCVTCLGSYCGVEGMHSTDDSVAVANLIELMAAVENTVTKKTDGKRMKKVSLKLSLIADMNWTLQKDGILSGTPNSHLAACAHLYLGIMYMFQKKERASAKHVLQVFCNAPFQARTVLLPALWNHLFSPHLSLLEAWHEKEVQYSSQTANSRRKMVILKNMYDDAMDTGTYNFAVYYKDWLSEENRAPLLPTIHVPSTSCSIHQEEFSGSAGSISSPLVSRGMLHHDASSQSQLMVSRKVHKYVSDHEDEMGANIKIRFRWENVRNEVKKKMSKEYSGSAGNTNTPVREYHTAACTLSGFQEHEGECAEEYYGMVGSERLNASSNMDRRHKPNCGIYILDRPEVNEYECALSKLAQAIFELQPFGQPANSPSSSVKHLQSLPEIDKCIDNGRTV